MSEPNAPGVQPASTEPPTAPPEKRKGVPWWVLALLLGGCLVITVPNLIEARRAPGENAPVGHLRTLATAQALYREGDKDKNSVLDFAPSLGALHRAGLIDAVLATGTKQGYVFQILHGEQFTWAATAIPLERGWRQERSYFIDERGVIRFTTDGRAPTSLDAAIGG